MSILSLIVTCEKDCVAQIRGKNIKRRHKRRRSLRRNNLTEKRREEKRKQYHTLRAKFDFAYYGTPPKKTEE
jgi:hypothetical protein